MGWVMMSERELNRVEVLAQVDDGRLSVDNAANMLALTRRQIFRLLKRYREDGASAIRHKSRRRAPNNQIHAAKRDYALTLIKEQYPDKTDASVLLEPDIEYDHLIQIMDTIRSVELQDARADLFPVISIGDAP